MSLASEISVVDQLRSLIRGVEKPADNRERIPFSLLPSGVPRGALVEITGAGKTEAAVKFLKENKKIRVAWVEDQMTICPSAVLQRQVALQRILFIEARQELPWALLQVLRSQLFECIVTSCQSHLPEKFLRRLQLEVEKTNTSCFLLTEKPLHAWPVSVQLQAGRDGKAKSVQLRIIKEK